jgi:uncharacterized alkaline shock family protein YloU
MSEETQLGKVEISPTAIATLAAQAVLQSYGVVGMAPKNLADELMTALGDAAHRGVEVRVDGDHIRIDLYVVVEYGTRISSVAHSIMNVVRYTVERALGVPVAQVNVHVQGLRVSNPDI